MRQAARQLLAGAVVLAALLPVLLALAVVPAVAARSAAHGVVTSQPSKSPSPSPSHSKSPSPSHSKKPAPRSTSRKPPPEPTAKRTRPAHSHAPGLVHAVRGMPLPTQGCPPQLGVPRLTAEPWAQQALDVTGAWNLTRGQGITVAVVDSGVDYTPQLTGRVSYLDLTGQGPQDCVGHGTAVASLIAASDSRAQSIPFYGIAPAAQILSVKVNSGENGYSSLLARGIRDAVTAGAQVINVSIQTAGNSPALRAAVSYALSRNVVVVAAAGNDNPGEGVGPYYPASYPGVISVGAVDQTGALTSYTDTRTPVSVTAPGENVASAWPGGYNPANQGTSFAAAFVSGVAALVRAAYPSLTAAQVVHRIEATADGTTGAHTGAGMVNPVQAVTAVLPSQSGSPTGRPQAVLIPGPPRANRFTRALALSITGGAIAAAVLVAIVAVVVPQGRRRGWRPARRSALTGDTVLAAAGEGVPGQRGFAVGPGQSAVGPGAGRGRAGAERGWAWAKRGRGCAGHESGVTRGRRPAGPVGRPAGPASSRKAVGLAGRIPVRSVPARRIVPPIGPGERADRLGKLVRPVCAALRGDHGVQWPRRLRAVAVASWRHRCERRAGCGPGQGRRIAGQRRLHQVRSGPPRRQVTAPGRERLRLDAEQLALVLVGRHQQRGRAHLPQPLDDRLEQGAPRAARGPRQDEMQPDVPGLREQVDQRQERIHRRASHQVVVVHDQEQVRSFPPGPGPQLAGRQAGRRQPLDQRAARR
jgi:membrane-anchored mycosin MYCP